METGEDRWSKGIIFFIIMTMARDGPIYGNQVVNLIYERTNGAWKPSAGSVYPALDRLTKKGFIKRYDDDGKVMYKITEKGSTFVKRIGERHINNSPMLKFMGKMWMDVLSPEDKARFLLNSIQNIVISLDGGLKYIHSGLENEKQFEVFLMSCEIEFEKGLKILADARKELTENKEVK
jgi:DNA-binding PadR family transcriptional regulator